MLPISTLNKLIIFNRKLLRQQFYTHVKQFTELRYEKYFKNSDEFGVEKKDKLSKQIALTISEHKFQKTRQLSQLWPKTFKGMVSRMGFEDNPSSQQHALAFEKVIAICALYNQILEDTSRVPSMVTYDQMRHMLKCVYRKELIASYLHHLYRKELYEWHDKHQRIEEGEKTKTRLNMKYDEMNADRIGIFNNCGEIVYGLWHNTLFTRFKRHHQNYLNARINLRVAAMFGQKLVIDFDYEEYIRLQDLKLLSTFVSKLYLINRRLPHPYHLAFCNLNDTGNIAKLLPDFIRDMNSNHSYTTVSSGCYTQLYDRQKIVYICEQADQLLLEYDHSAIYVLCGVLQSRIRPPLSMMKLSEQGIESRRIPVEQYFHIENNLEIIDNFRILNNMRNGMGLNKAIKNGVPNKYFKSGEQHDIEDNEVLERIVMRAKRKYRKDHSFDSIIF